jgi:hypothetical protein
MHLWLYLLHSIEILSFVSLTNLKIWKMDSHCIWSLGVQLKGNLLLGLLKETPLLMVSLTCPEAALTTMHSILKHQVFGYAMSPT